MTETRMIPPRIRVRQPDTSQVLQGIVTNADDPEKKGRVQVDFFGVNNHGKAWYEVAASNAGGAGGFHFTPHEGDTILATFVYGNPNSIYIIKGVHQSTDVKGHRYCNPNVFAITSRKNGGSSLVFDDNEKGGSAKLTDKFSSIYMDGQDTLTIQAPKIINILCGTDKNGKQTGIQINGETKTINIFGMHIHIGDPDGNQAADFSAKAKNLYLEGDNFTVKAANEVKTLARNTKIGGGNVYIP